jgi:hypothetical protein
MEAAELRIGNIVFFHDTEMGKITYTHEEIIRGYEIQALEVDGYIRDVEVEPIPLTEEWLLKFGFKQDSYSYIKGVHQKIFSGVMKFDFNETLKDWEFSVGYITDITRILYVHQLQNLYFALTGEELTEE